MTSAPRPIRGSVYNPMAGQWYSQPVEVGWYRAPARDGRRRSYVTITVEGQTLRLSRPRAIALADLLVDTIEVNS